MMLIFGYSGQNYKHFTGHTHAHAHTLSVSHIAIS